jgi:hypothetical protein
MITSVVRQKNPVAIGFTERKEQERQGMLQIGIYAHERPAAILSFSFKKATPSGFAPKRQLPSSTTGALHCTGTVAGGIFRRVSPRYLTRFSLLRRQNSKKIQQ